MPWLLYMHIFFSDFLRFDISLLLLTVTMRGVSNKHCLLSLFSLCFLTFQADFTLEYQPLRVGETNTKLDFSNNELGNYFYELNLKATPAGPERALYFRTCLGQSQVQVGKFLNFAKQKTDYSCKVNI